MNGSAVSDGPYREFSLNGTRYQWYGEKRWKKGTLPTDMEWINGSYVPPEIRDAVKGLTLKGTE